MRLYAAIFFATLSTVFIPLPEEATLFAAGYAARLGRVTVFGGIAAAWLAVLMGDTVGYAAGRFLLAPTLRTRIGQKLLPVRWRAWGEGFLTRGGARAVIVARFLIGLRGFVYLALGASRYPFGRFLLVDSLAGAFEVAGLVALGFGLGEMRAQVGARIDLAAGALVIAALFGPRLVRSAVRRSAALDATTPRA